MKAIYEKIEKPEDQSFSFEEYVGPYFADHWHFHREIEILYVKEGYGTKFIGDSISSFSPGEIVIIGSDTPHVWVSHSDHLVVENKLTCRALVILFVEDFLGKTTPSIPELNLIKQFLNEAKRGIQMGPESCNILVKYFERIPTKISMNKLIDFLKILDVMSTSKDIKFLSAPSYHSISINSEDRDRIETIVRYVIKNYQNKMIEKDVASMVNLTPHSFCRYFKSRTGKVFSSFVNEVRIGNSCKQIRDDKESISQICFESGFNYLSNFNRQFKKIKGITPSEYRSKYINQKL